MRSNLLDDNKAVGVEHILLLIIMRIKHKVVSGSAQILFQHFKIYINLVGKYFA